MEVTKSFIAYIRYVNNSDLPRIKSILHF
jgi:hypothetical protein